jgi:DHA1 family bicyclomycin/chloramphenicol resistance-like MFS transporter
MPIVAPLAGSVLLDFAGWRTIFLVMAVATVPLLMAAALWLPESRSQATRERAHGRHPLRAYAEMLHDRRLLGFLLAAGCNAACLFTYLSSSPLVMMNTYQLGPSTYSFAVAINALGLLGASRLNRRLLRTRRPQAILAGSARNAVLLGVAYVAFAATLWGELPVLLLLIFLAVASLSIVQNNTLACALSVDPQRAGAAAALFGAATFGIGTLMSYLAGLLYDGSARPMTLVIALNLLGTAAALRWLALPSVRARR